MKKITGVLLLLLVCGTASIAQEKRDTIKPANHTAAKMKVKEELGLSKEQAKKWKALKEDFKEKAKAIKDDTSLTKPQKKEKLRAIMKDHDEQLSQLLTPAQLEKWKQIKQDELKKKHGKKMAGDDETK